MSKKSNKFDENYITKLIIKKLEKREVGKFKKDFRLTNRKKFIELWKKYYSIEIPVLQPQVDLIIKTNSGDLNAMEIKYFRESKGKRQTFNYSYYKGIDQAIAYLRYGFDYVALWQIFDDIHFSNFKEYGKRTKQFLEDLNLPIDFTYFIFNKSDDSIKVVPYKIKKKINYRNLPKLESYDSTMGWHHPNPYRKEAEGKRFRRVIDEILIDHFKD